MTRADTLRPAPCTAAAVRRTWVPFLRRMRHDRCAPALFGDEHFAFRDQRWSRAVHPMAAPRYGKRRSTKTSNGVRCWWFGRRGGSSGTAPARRAPRRRARHADGARNPL